MLSRVNAMSPAPMRRRNMISTSTRWRSAKVMSRAMDSLASSAGTYSDQTEGSKRSYGMRRTGVCGSKVSDARVARAHESKAGVHSRRHLGRRHRADEIHKAYTELKTLVWPATCQVFC